MKNMKKFVVTLAFALMVGMLLNPVDTQAKTVKAVKTSSDLKVKVTDKKAFVYENKTAKPAMLDRWVDTGNGNGYYVREPMGFDTIITDRYYDFSQISYIPQVRTGKQYITFKDGFKGGNRGTHYMVMFIPDKTGTYQFTCTNRRNNKKVTKNFKDGVMGVYELVQDENGNFKAGNNGYVEKEQMLAYSKVSVNVGRISTCGAFKNSFMSWNAKGTPTYKYNFKKGKVYILSFYSENSFKKNVKVELQIKKVKNTSFKDRV